MKSNAEQKQTSTGKYIYTEVTPDVWSVIDPFGQPVRNDAGVPMKVEGTEEDVIKFINGHSL